MYITQYIIVGLVISSTVKTSADGYAYELRAKDETADVIDQRHVCAFQATE